MWIRKLFDSLTPARSRTPVRPAAGQLSVEALDHGLGERAVVPRRDFPGILSSRGGRIDDDTIGRLTELDCEVGRVGPSWAGLRTFAPDRNPVIGFDTRTPGLFWCAGQGGYGIQSAPACAQLAAALARDEPVPPMIAAEGVTAAAVSPARFTARAAR